MKKEPVKESEERYRLLIQKIRAGVIVHDSNTKIIVSNTVAQTLLGLTEDQLMGKTAIDPDWHFLREDGTRMPIEEYPVNKIMASKQAIHDYVVGIHQTVKKDITWVLVNGDPVFDQKGSISETTITFIDITDRIRNNAINAARLHLMKFAVIHTLDELLEETLNEAEKLTNSLIGFYHFVENDQISLTLQNWSTKTKAEFCKAEGKGLHYLIDQAGVWVDCVYQRKPVIHNDYASLPYKKGMPEGHAEVIRELVVPVLRGEKVKAILGVGNKADNYDEKDIEAISLLADLAWEIAERKIVDESLRQASVYNRSLIETSLDPLVTINTEGKITDVNNATEKATGRSRLQLIGTDFSDYFTEPDKARNGYQQVFAKGSVTNYPLAIRHQDGHVTEVLYNAGVFRNEAGNVLGVFAAARDVTERNKAEAALRENEALLQTTMKILPVGLWVLDAQGKIVFSNDVAKRIWTGVRYVDIEQLGEYKGWRLDNGRPVGARDWAGARAVEKGETSIEEEIQIECFDGTRKIILDSAVPLRGNDGNIRGAVTINQDITERKQAETILRESEAALKEAQRIAHVGSWHMDLATNEVYWSQVLYELYGLEPALSPPLYTDSMKLFTPESWERLSSSIAQTTVTGIPYELELEAVRKDGGRRWMWARGELVRDERGAPLRVRGVVMDITERKLAEKKIRDSEQKFKSMTDTSPLAIYMSSGIEQTAEYVNPTFTRLFGYTLDEVPAAAKWWPLAYPDETYRRQVEEEWQRKVEYAIKTSSEIEPMDVVVTCKDGSRKNILWGYISTGIQNWAFGLDLTERKRAENVIKEKEERLALATVKNGVGVWDWNLQTQEMIWDDSMYALYHMRREDFSGTEEAWRTSLHTDDLARGDQEVADAIAGKKPFETEFRVVWPDGEVRYIKAVAKVFRSEYGAPLRMLGINMDVTERNKAEQMVLELNRDLERRITERTAQLETANKELEAFSYSVSHDLRAPLRAINGFSHILQEEYAAKLDDEGNRLLNVVGDNANRMGQLIDDILKFSRTGRFEMNYSEVDMATMARNVYEELLPTARHVLQVEIGQLPASKGDRAMMRQVFVNLLSNAIKFTRNKKSAQIEVGSYVGKTETVYFVKDNGAGFDMKFVDKLFGVFQRLHTQTQFEGTGIGLAIVKRIVTRHGGRVWAEGKINEGATIYFALPL